MTLADTKLFQSYLDGMEAMSFQHLGPVIFGGYEQESPQDSPLLGVVDATGGESGSRSPILN